MASKHRDGHVVASIPGHWITYAHTIAGYSAFVGALIVGVYLHYQKIVQNEHFGYPIEWFPSVSATIGDRYPERSVFQLFIALTSGPRFILVGLWYVLTAQKGKSLPKFVAGVGVFRSLTCGGWTYVTSTDDHDWHDIFMISYLVATLPWTVGCISLSPANPRAIFYRKVLGGSFFATLVPLVYFFIQHKVHRVPGAYTIYAFFEWALVLLDLAFDAVTALDFESLELTIKDVKGASRGQAKSHDKDVAMHKDKPIDSMINANFTWSDVLDTLAHVYLAFVFWSVLTSLGLLIWYFPLWNMGLSGYEILVLSSISPFLLGLGPIRRLVLHNVGVLHLTSVIGILAYYVTSPRDKLFCVAFSVAATCLAWSVTFHAERSQPARLELRITSFVLGLIASSVAKFANQSNNPVWPIVPANNGGWHKTGALLCILAATRIMQSSAISAQAPQQSKTSSSFLPAAMGFGGLMFGLHSLLSDSSTMILWSWTGYPVRGPLAVPHGAFTLLAMGGGATLGLYYSKSMQSWTAFGIGAVGAALLTGFSHWTAWYGGLVLAVYLTGIASTIIATAARHPAGRTFFTGFFFYNILVLAHVWTTAYAFVPGGPLLRERTSWVMTAMMLLIGSAIFSINGSINGSARSLSSTLNIGPAMRRGRANLLYILLALQLVAAAVAYLRFPSYDYTPYHAPDKAITAGIWTIHFALDDNMRSSEKRMGDLIREMELDVVGLLETDLQHIIMGNRDAGQYLSEELGMWVDQGPGPNKHTWGCVLLSKFPIINSTHHLLPSPVGELAPAIHATISAYGELVDVFVFHSGQEEDVEDRRLQSNYMAELMGSTTRPSILLSYLVTKTGQGNYNTYVSPKSGMRDIDPSDGADRWCEYILYKGLKRSGYARVSRSDITDTELQVGKFVVGQPEGTDQLIPESDVVPGLRFPAMFRGEGVRGHRYHVFNEPRYFA